MKENATDIFGEKLPLFRKIFIGIQHILTMAPGNIAAVMILSDSLKLNRVDASILLASNFFVSGLATIIQGMKGGKIIGSGIPLVIGAAFAPIGVMIMIGEKSGGGSLGLATVFGSVIGSGILMFIISFFFKKNINIFPAVVVGCFVTMIGAYLAPLALNNIAGGYSSDYGNPKNLLLGFTVYIIVIAVEKFGNPLISNMGLFFGILAGTLIAIPMGMVDFTPVIEANNMQMIIPLKYGINFQIGPIVLVTLFSIINLIQCLGVFSVADTFFDSKTTDEQKIKGLRTLSLSQAVAGVFNGVPLVSFNENVGLLNLTKVKSREVTITAGILLVFFSLFPKFSALITIIPKPVIGGVTLVLFGIITSAGLSILSTLDFKKDHNFTIIGSSIVVGIGVQYAKGVFSQLPPLLEMLLSNGILMVCLTAIILNQVLNRNVHNEK